MEVTINGDPIDYRLEGERLLGEVVDAVEKWINGAGAVVTCLRVGDRDLASVPEPEWAALPVESIARLDITARSISQLEEEQLDLVDAYLGQIEGAAAGTAPLPAGAPGDFGAVAAAMRGNLALASDADPALGELEQLLKTATADSIRSWPDAIRARAQAAAARLRAAVRARIDEIAHPEEAMRAAAAQLAGSSRDLAEVSVLLQTGRDAQAMARIDRFALLLQTVLRVAGRLSRDARPAAHLKDAFGSLNVVLGQAAEALAARDTVLLGDLLEYEVAPRLASLSARLAGAEAGAR